MEKVTIEIKKKSARKTLLRLQEKREIKILETIPAKEKLKKRVKKDLEEGFRLIKLHEAGKVKLKSARQLLNEL